MGRITEWIKKGAVEVLQSAGPGESAHADLFFRPTFAIFLRHNWSAWRMRRVDRFEPVEVVLARQHTTIQGVYLTVARRRVRP